MTQEAFEYDDSGIRIIERDEPEVIAAYVTGAPPEAYDPDPFGLAADDARHGAERAAIVAARIEAQLKKRNRKAKTVKASLHESEINIDEIISAGLLRRVLAFCIDGIIIVAAQGALTYAGLIYAPTNIPFISSRIPAIDLKFQLVTLGIMFLYGIFLIFAVGRNGQTPGKKLLGIRIVRDSDLMPIGFLRSLYRYLIPAITSIVIIGGTTGIAFLINGRPGLLGVTVIATAITYAILGFMYLSVGWSYMKRGMIDRIAGVRAVNIRSGIDPLNYDI